MLEISRQFFDAEDVEIRNGLFIKCLKSGVLNYDFFGTLSRMCESVMLCGEWYA